MSEHCARCQHYQQVIVDLQHQARKARHVEENLEFANGLLRQKLAERDQKRQPTPIKSGEWS